jgi:anti-sigma regulatory factor (Ser/Thr protein kinase)
MGTDEISLTLPADDAFRRVAHLVLGGLAARLDVTFEDLEDLELALDALLERVDEDGEITLRVRVTDDELQATVGPFSSVRDDLAEGAAGSLNLHRILGTVCDSVEIAEQDGSQWVALTKRIDSGKTVAR